jgi:acetolactate synthase regulatory subunit
VRSQRHIIAVTLQNEVGALTRVAGLFSTRGYNIESLSVAPTDDPSVSRLTVVTTGSDAVIQQISNQCSSWWTSSTSKTSRAGISSAAASSRSGKATQSAPGRRQRAGSVLWTQ